MVLFHSPSLSLAFSQFLLLSHFFCFFFCHISMCAGDRSCRRRQEQEDQADRPQIRWYLPQASREGTLSGTLSVCVYIYIYVLCIGFVIEWLEVVISCTASLCGELEASSMRWYWRGCLWARSTNLHSLSPGWSVTWGERFVFSLWIYSLTCW